MKTLTSIFATVWTILAVAAPLTAEASVYVADSEKSTINWMGEKITGKHNGKLKLRKGSVKMKGDSILSANFELDMQSITVSDIKDPKYNKKLTDHLKNDDFFSTDAHPVAKFDLNEIKPQKGGALQAFGDLTIKGIKKPISFPVKVVKRGASYVMSGKAIVDRTKYDIKYKSGKFFPNLGDKVIKDNFEVSFSINASPKAKATKPNTKY